MSLGLGPRSEAIASGELENEQWRRNGYFFQEEGGSKLFLYHRKQFTKINLGVPSSSQIPKTLGERI